MEGGYGRHLPAKTALSPESAIAADFFDQFAAAQTFKSVLGTFRLLCDTLRLKPNNFSVFYPKLKAKLRSWKAQALWSKFDKRAGHKCYNRGRACIHTRVLIIGAGPCGLRTAIEAQLLGAKVVVIEKRDRFSRNNVLHLWPFVIHDLRALGAKKFFGKFCAGAIDHISIRQLQCILLKVALLLGVEIHENVTFESLKEPPSNQSEEKIGWRAAVIPEDHPVSQYEFDILIGADGKRNTLRGFRRKEFRGKLAIAITANFINRHSEAEARVEEISGVAFIFNQKFFQDMREQTGIDLENIVYYKDETHYFVMTAKKQSLIEKGVILHDFSDTAKLLAPDNVDREALMEYAREAADFATNYQLPILEFAVNHYGQADVAMFDFTSMYAAESASKVLERKGHRLLMGLVGDSLLEPFWPTGSGCARGFLSSLDACWMMRSWALGTMTPLQVLAERESIYRLLAQTTPENLNKDYNEITLNPHSRYSNLNIQAVRPIQVRSLYDSDCPISDEHLEIPIEMPKKKRKRDSIVHPDTLLFWCKKQVALYDSVKIVDMTTSWKNGLALCAIIHHYRPDLIDFHSLKEEDVAKNNQLAFDICEQEFGISPIMTGDEMAQCSVPDKLSMVSYISQIYDTFRGEIPYIAKTSVELSPEEVPSSISQQGRQTPSNRLSLLTRLSQCLSSKKQKHALERYERNASADENADRRPKKRRSLDKERALFILNKEQKQPSLLPSLYRKDGEKISFSDRVKTLEELLSGNTSSQVRHEPELICHFAESELNARMQKSNIAVPKATQKVGRLEKSDWNVKMLEDRLKDRDANLKKEHEAIPKWNKDCFEDKLRAMDNKLNKEISDDSEKYSAFDNRLRILDQKLKEGNSLERGQRGSNKVSAMAEQLAAILEPKQEHPPLIRSNSRLNMMNAKGGSEICHFCTKRVYLMERLSAQGKFFHRGCFKCEYCGTALRLGNYGYAADGNFGGKFLCMQHFGMPVLSPRKRPAELSLLTNENLIGGTPAKLLATNKSIIQPLHAEKVHLDAADSVLEKLRGATPERVEFENSIVDLASEEEILSEIDEDEWTDRNFGTTTTDLDSTDEDESDFSSEEISDDDQEFEEALQRSLSSDETRRLAETWKYRYSRGKLLQNDSDLEESDEEYDESEDEYSYKAYIDDENDERKAEMDERPMSPIPSEEIKKISSPLDELPEEDEEAAVLESEEESSPEDETEVGSDESSSDEYSDSAEEEDQIPVVTHSIPEIVINESPPTQPEIDEEVFIHTLQQQQQPLLAESLTSTPVVEQKPLFKIPSTQSYYALEEITSEVSTPTNQNSESISETPCGDDLKSFPEMVSKDELEEKDIDNISSGIVENVIYDNPVRAEVVVITDTESTEPTADSLADHVPEKESMKLKTSDSWHDEDENAEAIEEANSLEGESIASVDDQVSSISLDLSEKITTPEDDDFSKPELIFERDKITPDDNEGEDYVKEMNGSYTAVNLRVKTSKSVERDLKTKSLIEPLGRTVTIDASPETLHVENGQDETVNSVKPLETATSLPNLLDDNAQVVSPEETPTSRKILKLKELYLFGEANSTEQTPKTTDVKSPPTKIEPVVKSVLEMITEKQKMLSPAPLLSSSVHIGSPSFASKSPPEQLFSTSLPTNYRLADMHAPVSVLNQSSSKFVFPSSKSSDVEGKSAVSEPVDVKKEAPLDNCLNGDASNVKTIPCISPAETKINVLSDVVHHEVEDKLSGEAIEAENEEKAEEVGPALISVNSDPDNVTTLTDDQQQLNIEEPVPETFNIDTSFITFRNKSKLDKMRSVSVDSSLDILKSEEMNEDKSPVSLKEGDVFSVEQPTCQENINVEIHLDKSADETENLKDDDNKEGSHSPTLRYEGHFANKISPFKNIIYPAESKKSEEFKKYSIPVVSSSPAKKRESADSLFRNKSDASNVDEPILRNKNITNLLQKESKTQNRRSIHEQIEEIPFADDDNNADCSTPKNKDTEFFTPQTSVKGSSHDKEEHTPSSNSSGTLEISPETPMKEKFYTPDKQPAYHDLRLIKTVEREKARLEARERARLKSDEELGLSPVVYEISNLRKKNGKEENEEDIKSDNGEIEEQKNSEKLSSSSSNETTKAENDTEFCIEDAEMQVTPLKEKSATWGGFNLKSKSPKSEMIDSDKGKNKEKRGLLALISSFTKSDAARSRGKENIKKPLTKSLSLEAESSSKDKFLRLKLTRSKEKKEKDVEKRKKKEMDSSFSVKDSRPSDSEYVRPERPKELILDKTALKSNIAEITCHSKLLQESVQSNSSSAPRASEDSFSESEEEDNVDDNSAGSAKRAKELTEEKLRKLQRIARRVYRQQEQKKLRMAQEIQRQLEELEVKQHKLEERGVRVEKALRGEGEEEDRDKDETELMQEWFMLVHEKNVLVRYEQELMVRAKELELEDRHSRLQQSLREKMAIDDSQKTQEEIEEEGRILAEMLEIVEQRDTLVAMLEEDRLRYKEEDEDLESSLLAKGYNISTPCKT